MVKAAYVSAGRAVDLTSSRPREVRAWAASLAFAQLCSQQSILDAAYWRSEGTFSHFYLRDVSRLRENGSRGIGSVVAAHQRLSAPPESQILSLKVSPPSFYNSAFVGQGKVCVI